MSVKKSIKGHTLIVYTEPKRRTTEELKSLADAEIDYTHQIAYKQVSEGEASDLYAINEVLYINIGNTFGGIAPPLRLSKGIVKNIWNINLSFFKLVDFLMESHFNSCAPPSFFLEIPIKPK